MTIEPVARFHSPVKGKFGIPRQAGLAPDLIGEVRLIHPYDAPEAVRGLEGFEYCWLIWGFSQNRQGGEHLTVRPPRLGGNERVGVFASRSPYRPNAMGLSCVKIISVEPGIITVSGADLADDTPIYDIKPYLEYADSRPGAKAGFVGNSNWKTLEVEIPESLIIKIGEAQSKVLIELLSQDPRPKYQDDPERVYGFTYNQWEVKFRVKENKVFVLSAENTNFAAR